MERRSQTTGWIMLALALVNSAGIAQNQPKRVALVIGAQNYTELPPLRNSLRDAQVITQTLQQKGFQVKPLYDPKTKREIKDAINWYFNEMRDQTGAVGLIYYAGHGMQYQGENYIIPTTAALQNPGDLEDYCVKMNTVIAIINSATTSLNILLLDACRSLPSFTRGVDQGLTKMDAPEGAIIVFATQPGKVASDGTGENGLFTSKLLGAINEPNLNISEVFQKVKREVYAESNKLQLPSIEDNAIGGEFYFTPGNTPKQNAPIAQTPVPIVIEKKPQTPVTVKGTDFGYGMSATKAVMIGDLKWLTQNLNLDHFNNGDVIPEAKTRDDWEKAGKEKKPVWGYPHGQAIYAASYGRLYNYYAATDPRFVCPTGWHVSTEEEWVNLIDYVGEDAPSKLKSRTSWYDKHNGDDVFGFTGLPAGSTYHAMEMTGAWFSLSPDPRIGVRGMNHYGDRVWKFAQYEQMGFAIRCVSNDTRPGSDKKVVSGSNLRTFKIVSEVVPKLDFGYGPGESESVVINDRKWISRNLAVDHFANNDPIPGVKTKEEWSAASANKQPAWCYPEDAEVNGPLFGKLYNFYAVSDPRGLCPAGWVAPANQQWVDMLKFIGPQEAGVQLKANNSWRLEGNGVDGLGFSALSGGVRLDADRHKNVGFYGFGDIGYFWSSTEVEDSGGSVYVRQLYSDKNYVVINSAGKGQGLSVRCIKK